MKPFFYAVLISLLLSACARNVLFQIFATPPSAQERELKQKLLKVATWNMEWLNHEENQGNVPRTTSDYKRLSRYAQILDADIIALQEVDGPDAAAKVFDAKVYDFHFTSDRNLQRTGFAYKRNLKVDKNPDFVALAVNSTRSAADITVKLDGNSLRILSVHLISGCWDDLLSDATEACQILNKQLPVLESWVKERGKQKTDFIIIGDFNRRMVPTDEFWEKLEHDAIPKIDIVNATEGRKSECWGGEYPYYLDHIILGNGASRFLKRDSFQQMLYSKDDEPYKEKLSDHCPIAVILELACTK